MIVAFGVAALIILLSVFLVVRQRVREIGIMKALGASNWRLGSVLGWKHCLSAWCQPAWASECLYPFSCKC